MHILKYIERLDKEIDSLIRKEGENLTSSGERDLHYLFENRKHVLCWKEENGNSINPAIGVSTYEEKKSYFGGTM